jgi:hypothetical protein
MVLEAMEEPGLYEVLHFNQFGDIDHTTCDPFDYTSAMVHSKKRYLYGHFEIRAKIPNEGKVLWPAFWLWAGDGGYREIDVFEFGGTAPNVAGMNMHVEPALDGGYVHTLHDATPPYNNNYPYNYTVPANLGGVSQTFHTYAVRWTPNVVEWSVDGTVAYSIKGHSPPLDMYIIANLAIAWWPPFPCSTDFPADFEIDYIRVYRSLGKEFLWEWGNNGAGALDWWHMSLGDDYVVGDFDGDGRDDLLATSSNSGYAHLMAYGSSGWTTKWTNNGSHQIHWWYLSSGDQILVGDADLDGRDDLLAVSQGGWAHLMDYSGGAWSTPWSNEGAGTIQLWHMTPTDTYQFGRFSAGSGARVLALAQNGWAQVLSYRPLPSHP